MFHRTREGIEMPIAAMADDHLLATIELLLKPMKAVTDALKAGSAVGEQSAKSKALYGRQRKLSESKAKEIHEATYRKVGPYVLEAALRGLGVRPQLIEAFGRGAADLEAPQVTDMPNPLSESDYYEDQWGKSRRRKFTEFSPYEISIGPIK